MKSAIVLGSATGLGKGFALSLASRGWNLTLIDINGPVGQATADECAAVAKGHGTRVQFIQCDALNFPALASAFDRHVAAFASLDLAILNAGIGEGRSLLEATSAEEWRATLDLDLTAMIEATRLAARLMRSLPDRKNRHIVTVASAAGIFPMFKAPVYSAAKGGLVHFVRSLAHLAKSEGIVVQSLCPQFVSTPLVAKMMQEDPRGSEKAIRAVGGQLLTVDDVVKGLHYLMEHGEGGSILRIASHGKLLFWQGGENELNPNNKTAGSLVLPSVAESRKRHLAQLAELARQPVPSTRRVLKVQELSTDFRRATRIFLEPLPALLPPRGVLIRRLFTGINASDVNFSAGRYHGEKEARRLLPFDAGFESVGVVVRVGADVKSLRPGQPVATMTYGGFSDYAIEQENVVLPVAEASPQVVALLTSGLTAALGLEKGGMRSGEKVLVTAAAGGTGQFAVQLAKLAGNTVIATCGGPEKAALLRSLGVDRVIDYTRESVKEVLRREYPSGVDVVFESVGGEMLQTCVDALARQGRLIIIGMMSEYTNGWGSKEKASVLPGLAEKLLWKSAAVHGFFLPHYARLMRPKLRELTALLDSGKLKVSLDSQKFLGLEQAADAVDRLQSGRSLGKVVLEIAADVNLSLHTAGAAEGGAAPRSKL